MAAHRNLRIGLIPGDGIGKEVIPAGRKLLEALSTTFGLNVSFTDLDAGFECFQRTGKALPDHTLYMLKNECHGALFGAVSSPTKRTPGYSSPIVQLRKKLDLYANIRPVKTVSTAKKPIDLVIVRENTEDLYIREETERDDPELGRVAEAIKRTTERATTRIATMAADIALRRMRIREVEHFRIPVQPKVTVTHKSNVLPATDGLFRSVCLQVLEKNSMYQMIQPEEQIIDSMLYKLYRQPEDYDVVVANNLYGDLLSDAAAALVGSLGVVPSANVGDKFALGEPCHGSAPDIQGLGIANPIATMRSVGVMLEFLDEQQAAAAIYKAVDANLEEASVLTPDMGGTASTDEVVEDVLNRL